MPPRSKSDNRCRPFAFALGCAVLGVGALLSGCGGAAPKEFQPTQPINRWDNSQWQKVLDNVVTNDGMVKYDLLTSNANGVKDALYHYVGLVNTVSPDSRPDLFAGDKDKLAYYINAYNALCMYAVLQHNLPSDMKLSGIFILDKFPVGGTSYSLDSLEKQKVRSAGDVRVHFALNCMSRSCPPLRKEAYDGAKLDDQLSDQGHIYLSDPRGAQKGDAPDAVKLSEIMGTFYKDEFISYYNKTTGKQTTDLLEALQPLAAPGSPVIGAKTYTVMKYDWSLNRAS